VPSPVSCTSLLVGAKLERLWPLKMSA